MKKVIQFSHKLYQAVTQLKSRKLIHKIGKQWVVIGISALVLSLGGVALSSTTHAADVQDNNAAVKIRPKVQSWAKALHTQIIKHADHGQAPVKVVTHINQQDRTYSMKADPADENAGLVIVKNSGKSNQRRPVKRNHRAHRGKRSIRRPRIRRNRDRKANRISYVSSSTYRSYQRQIRNLRRRARHGSRYARRIARRSLARWQRQFKSLRIRRAVNKRRAKRIRRYRARNKIIIKKNRRRAHKSMRHAKKSQRIGTPINESDNDQSTLGNSNFVVSPNDNDSNPSNVQQSDTQQSASQTDQSNNVTPSDQQSDQTSQSDQSAQPSNSQSSNGNDQSSQSDSTPSTDTLLQQMKDRTFADINNDRAQYGLSPLQENSDMMKLGQERADQTASLGQLQHYDSNGQMYETEDANQMGTNLGNRWGENLSGAGLGNMTMEGDPNQFDNHNGNDMADMAEDAMLNHDQDSGWGHRRNILDSRFTTIGIGASQSNGNFYIAEDFGNNN